MSEQPRLVRPINMPDVPVVGQTPRKMFKDFLDECGGLEIELYKRRRTLAFKPVGEWTPDDLQMAIACSFEWCLWMEAVTR